MNDSTFRLYLFACIHHSTIQVWGIVSICLYPGFVRTSFEMNEKDSTLSL